MKKKLPVPVKTPDRVTISLSRTIQIVQYEPLTVTVSYSRDKGETESPQTAIERTEKFVIDEFNKLLKEIGRASCRERV